uniref:BTB domain-containing protein n=1 Tax=Bracon brevicornis TaxID=1563983 RepID=A0A6V7I2R9_9HYME
MGSWSRDWFNELYAAKVTYKWKITSFTLRPYDLPHTFHSPLFDSPKNNELKWQLLLIINEDGKNSDNIGLYLQLHGPNEMKIRGRYKFSIVDSVGLVKDSQMSTIKLWEVGQRHGESIFTKRHFLIEDYEFYLPDDTLTLCCELETFTYIPFILNKTLESNLQNMVNGPRSLRSFEELMCDKDMASSDVNILCGSKVFPAHRMVLAIHSSVFTAMFQDKHLSESQHSVIRITDVSPEVIEEMLNFMYNDRVDNEDLALELLYLSERYELKRLKAKCQLMCIRNIHQVNAVDLLISADCCNAKELKQQALKFITENEFEVWTTVGFNAFSASHAPLAAELYNTRITNLLGKRLF